jgi:hypothetical protein
VQNTFHFNLVGFILPPTRWWHIKADKNTTIEILSPIQGCLDPTFESIFKKEKK